MGWGDGGWGGGRVCVCVCVRALGVWGPNSPYGIPCLVVYHKTSTTMVYHKNLYHRGTGLSRWYTIVVHFSDETPPESWEGELARPKLLSQNGCGRMLAGSGLRDTRRLGVS